MIKLNIFFLFNFFLIINSESCQNNIWKGCNCSTKVFDQTAKNIELELSIFDCERELKKLPEIHNIIGIFLDSTNISSFPNNLILKECIYKNVTRLSITNTKINSLKNSDFVCLSKLQQLDISQNEITTINADAFKYLTELNQLLLRKNKIFNVDQNSFCGLFKLHLLDLQNNLIKSLPENI